MIPADRFLLSDDGTEAWWVWDRDEFDAWSWADAPCDICDGTGCLPDGQCINHDETCPDCIDGRHTFGIEVDTPKERDRSYFTYRVSIVPGMVLPIYNYDDDLDHDGTDHMCLSESGRWAYVHNGSFKGYRSDAPPAAAPGLYAVKLRVAS